MPQRGLGLRQEDRSESSRRIDAGDRIRVGLRGTHHMTSVGGRKEASERRIASVPGVNPRYRNLREAVSSTRFIRTRTGPEKVASWYRFGESSLITTTRRRRPTLVPTLRVGMPSSTLGVATFGPAQGRGASRTAFPRGAWERGENRHPIPAVARLTSNGRWC